MKKQDLEAENRRLSNEHTLLARALQVVMNHETEFPVSFFAKEVQPDEPGRYTFRFFDSDSPAGERVIVTYVTAGQKDYHVVYEVDQQQEYMRRNPSAIWSRIFWHALANRKRKVAA